MKKKFIVGFIILSALFLFSMQLCSLIFGNKPDVVIVSPQNNANITTTTLTVSGRITDNDGDQKKVKVWIEDTDIINWDYDVASGNFSVVLDLSSKTANRYTIIAQGYDANNNQSDTVSVTINYNPEVAPTVTISSPTANSNITTPTLTVTGTITDPNGDANSVRVSIDGTGIIEWDNDVTSGQFSVELDLSSLEINHQYTISVQGYDSNVNRSEIKTVTINYNPEVAPTVTITSPTANSTITTPTLTVTGTITDPNGDANSVRVSIDGTGIIVWDNDVTSGEFSVILNLSALTANTQYTVNVKGYDSKGNGSEIKTVTINYNPEVAPTVTITSPTNGSSVTLDQNGLTVSGTINDANNDASYVKIWIDITDIYNQQHHLEMIDDTLSGGVFSVTFIELGIQIAPSGQMTAYAQGYDLKQNESQIVSTTFNYTIASGGNGNPPVVTITSPTLNTNVTTTTLIVTGTITDPNGDANSVRVSIDGTGIIVWDNDVTSGEFSVELDLSSLEINHQYTISVQGYDSKGNGSEIKTVTINYNPEVAPTVTITSPTNGSSVTLDQNGLTVSGTISDPDNDASYVKVWINVIDIYNQSLYLEMIDNDLSGGVFSVTFNDPNILIQIAPEGQMTAYAQGYDLKQNESQIVSTTFDYIISGGGSGSAPVVTIMSPENYQTITTSSLLIQVSMIDYDEDKSHVTATVVGYSGITSTSFQLYNDYFYDIDLDLSSLSSGEYTIEVIGYDTQGHASDPKYVTINYTPGSSNLLLNGHFTDPNYKESDVTYSDSTYVNTYLNNPNNGDFLPNWTFYIGSPEEDWPKIDIGIGYVRMYTANSNSNGSEIGMQQDTEGIPNLITSSGKKIKIMFKIGGFAGGECKAPYFEAPVKITIKVSGTEYVIAAFTTKHYSASGGYGEGYLPTGTIFTKTFDILDKSLGGLTIPSGQQIEMIKIVSHGWTWDVTIYSIEVY